MYMAFMVSTCGVCGDIFDIYVQISCVGKGLLHYLEPVNRLPTVDQTGIPAKVSNEVNKAVHQALDQAP